MQSAPQAPPTPDPRATAAAQTQGDVQSAIANTVMGNANETSPLGSVNYRQIGTYQIKDAQGNPIDVPKYERVVSLSPEQQALYDQQYRAGYGLNDLAIGQIARLSDTLNKPLSTAGLPAAVNSVGSGPQLATSYASGGPIQKAVDLKMNPTTFGQTAGNIQYDVGPNDFSEDRKRVEDALYARLNPQLERDRASLEQRLANQGLTPGGEAWNKAYDAYTRQANDARLGVIREGGAEQSRLFGLDLSKGQFHNTAQGQDYGQQEGRGRFGLDATTANNASTLSMGQFVNDAQRQAEEQAAARAGFSNSALQQGFQNEVTGATFSNTARERALQEQLALRNQPINEISALMAGGQVSMPQFAQYNPGNVAGSTVAQNIYGSAALDNQKYQTQAQQAAAYNAGLFGLGSSLIGAGGRVMGGRMA